MAIRSQILAALFCLSLGGLSAGCSSDPSPSVAATHDVTAGGAITSGDIARLPPDATLVVDFRTGAGVEIDAREGAVDLSRITIVMQRGRRVALSQLLVELDVDADLAAGVLESSTMRLAPKAAPPGISPQACEGGCACTVCITRAGKTKCFDGVCVSA